MDGRGRNIEVNMLLLTTSLDSKLLGQSLIGQTFFLLFFCSLSVRLKVTEFLTFHVRLCRVSLGMF